MDKSFDRPERHFHFSKEATYIEHQEITVQSGATFYNGPSPKSNNDGFDEDLEFPDSKTSAESSDITTPIDWCQAGIRAVMAGGHLEFSSDWAAVMKIIREVSVFDTLTPSGMVDMIKNAGTEIDEELMPGVDNIRRVEVNGKFPEWTTKGYDSTSRYLQIAQDFLKGYRQKKG